MPAYAAPLRDMRFVMSELAGFEQVRELPGFEDISLELAHAVLDEAGKFASGVLAPLNRSADHQGARFRDGAVTTPDGTRDAYRQYCEAGWNGISAARVCRSASRSACARS
jgi:hypothetical protein